MLTSFSFRRASAELDMKKPVVQGVKLLPKQTGPHISSGMESLDEVLGGGLPLGSLLILEEDRFTGYAHLLLRYYISQGLVHGHDLVLISADENPRDLLASCPGYDEYSTSVEERTENSLNDEEEATGDQGEDNMTENVQDPIVKGTLEARGKEASSEEKLKIAWRYQNLPKLDSNINSKKVSFQIPAAQQEQVPFCSKFFLTQKIPPSIIENAAERLHFLDLTQSEDPFEDLYYFLSDLLSRKKYLKKENSVGEIKQVLRIAIFSFCSPFWRMSNVNDSKELCCLHRLKALLHRSSASVYLTLSHTYTKPLAPVRKLSDFQFTLEAFSTSPRWMHSPLTSGSSDYTGLFLIQKLGAFHSLSPVKNQNSNLAQNLAFSVRRKRFLIEPWHLPPDLSLPGASASTVKQQGCSSFKEF